jgi:trimethylamine:corrinoid methyltransferase-like protein
MRFFDLLSPDELEQIHHKALEVLEKVGCIIEHQEALAILQIAGAKVDFAKHRAFFSELKAFSFNFLIIQHVMKSVSNLLK